jgi:uncharacterized protein YcfJ
MGEGMRKLVMMAFAGGLVAGPAAAQVILYEGEGFHGYSFAVRGTLYNLERGDFNDRASSVIVERGRWEVCEHERFAGYCALLLPGQYPSLKSMGMNNRISSIRQVTGPTARPPAPPPPVTYPYYPRPTEQLYQADVVAVRAVLGPPQQRCWVEREQVVATHPHANVAGAVVGGIIGGVIGHQIGSGRGNDVATAVGAVGGAAVGATVAGRHNAQVVTQDVQRCADIPGSAQPAYWDVTYVFRGLEHRAQMAFQPGPTITVNRNGEPRV